MSTYKKIAHLAGVSLSTVSKALSGSAEVSEATREKIIKIANETGYFKDKNRRKLDYSKGRSLNIALVCPEIISIFYSQNLTHIKKEIESRGGTTFIYTQDFNDDKTADIIKHLTINGVIDGIVLMDAPYDAPSDIPVVALTSKSLKYIDSVGIDTNNLWCDAVKYLKSRGHTKIGYVGETLTSAVYNSVRFALDRNNLEINMNYFYSFEKRFEEIGKCAADEITKSTDRPTAICAAYAEIAVGLVHKLIRNGISVPDEISVITKNNTPSCAYSQVPLTTFDLFSEEVAKNIVDILYDKINKHASAIKHITFDYKLIERESVKDIS